MICDNMQNTRKQCTPAMMYDVVCSSKKVYPLPPTENFYLPLFFLDSDLKMQLTRNFCSTSSSMQNTSILVTTSYFSSILAFYMEGGN